MREQDYAVNNGVQADQLEVSRVLRNTYGLLALTLAFSGVMAFVSQQMNFRYPNVFVVLIGFYGLLARFVNSTGVPVDDSIANLCDEYWPFAEEPAR